MSVWDKPDRKDSEVAPRREPDDFWDVENLLPPRPARKTPPPPRETPAAVDIELTPRSHSTDPASVRPVSAAPLTVRPPATAEHREENRPTTAKDEPLLEYRPEGALLHNVRIFGWQANYHYFDSFVEDAIRFHAMKPPAEAKREPFFSYFPQYVQMRRRATAWYLFWRECVRGGRYPDTDYAYILLYLFELINLPTEHPDEAREHRDLMAKTWVAYRCAYPQLDHYMCEWLCDYCLIHELSAPIDILAPALDDIIMGSRLKEFYLSAAVRIPEAGGADTSLETARILMRHCCQYDYRKSKFSQGEHKELFDETIPAAIAHVLPLLLGANGQKPAVTMLDSSLTRDAYTGALCSYRNKRRIEVFYTSFSRSHELRFLIGDMVKHVENRLRGWIGVRSRLSVMSLPVSLRDALDAYLAPRTPPKGGIPSKKKEEPRPAYEVLYDLPSKPVSVADAAAIEADSWETTRILVEAFGGEVTEPPAEIPPTVSAPPSCELESSPAPSAVARDATPEDVPENTLRGALTPYFPFVRSAWTQDPAAQRAAASALRKMPDAIVDAINAITADSEIGDIILEDNGTGTYTVIEEYRDVIHELLHVTENRFGR